MKTYYVYMMASRSRRLYTGITSDLTKRVYQHQSGTFEGFSKKYQMTRLVYYETTNDVRVAIAREKQLKGWVRRRKLALVEAENPDWKDLSE
ncbi:MAG: GIY-YIG nuclease family protein [Gemmatimonadota bacterium]